MNPIQLLRLQTGLTQNELASLAGTSQPTIAAYEADIKSPSVITLNKIAKAAGLELAISYVPPMTTIDKRSLAYHKAIVKILRNKPFLIDKAKNNLNLMCKLHPTVKELFERWGTWLDLPTSELIKNVLDKSVVARDMRQVSPFSGMLNQKERLNILKNFQKEIHK